MSYTIAFERDETTKLITDVLVDGVSITKNKKRFSTGKSFLSALKKAQTTSYWKEYVAPQTCYNTVSGVSMELPAFEASIYAWCMRWYASYERYAYAGIGKPEAPTQTFDNMKYFLLALNSEAYYTLID